MSVQIITIGVIILFVFLGYQSFMALIHANGNITLTLIHSSILIFLIATIIICYLFAPQKYSIDKYNCIIHRPVSDISIKNYSKY